MSLSHKCCIRGCEPNIAIRSMFKAPKKIELREKWQQSTGLMLGDNSYICELHFNRSEIIRTWESGVGLSKVCIDLKKIRLKKDTVPSLNLYVNQKVISFLKNEPESNNKICPRELFPIESHVAMSPVEKKVSFENDDINIVSHNENVETIMDVEMCYPNDSGFLEANEYRNHFNHPCTYNEILSDPYKINIPENWNVQRLSGANGPIIIYYCIQYLDGFGPILDKQVFFGNDSKLKIMVQNQTLSFEECEISIPNDWTLIDLENVLNTLANKNVCYGGPSQNVYPNISVRTAFKHYNRWRSINCSKFIDTSGLNCSSCNKIYNSLTQSKYRSQKGTMKRQLIISPRKMKTILTLKNKKKQIQKQLYRKKQENKHIKNELSTIKMKMNDLNNSQLNCIYNNSKIPDTQKSLIKECIAASKVTNTKNRRYSDHWMLLCLLLNIKSPCAYKSLRDQQILPLPCTNTVRKYLSMVNMDCGFDKKFFELLKKSLSNKNINDRRGVLMVDEIILRESLTVNTRNLTYIGLEDFGLDEINCSENDKQKANHGLVFMFQSLKENYSQPIAVFASHGPVKGTVIAQLILKAILLLENSGALKHGIISDGATTNRKMWDEFGISGKIDIMKNYFQHPLDESRKIWMFSDTPHLFKNVRNRLYNKKCLRMNNKEPYICWSHYWDVYNQDNNVELKPSILKVCPKISKNHLDLTSLTKMRVKLMTQVFSNSMADGIKYYREVQQIKSLKFSKCTEDWTRFLNNVFDALNRKFCAEGLRMGNNDFEVLKEAEKWLNGWEREMISNNITPDEFLTNNTSEGLRITLRSTIEISEFLLKECGYSFVLTAKINQDSLEKFFGIIRQANGPNDHPTTPTFLQLYRIL